MTDSVYGNIIKAEFPQTGMEVRLWLRFILIWPEKSPNVVLKSVSYGTTPEEADLRGASSAEVSIVNTGVAITRILQEHPVNINTFASEIVLPSFERMDEVAVLNVLGG